MLQLNFAALFGVCERLQQRESRLAQSNISRDTLHNIHL